MRDEREELVMNFHKVLNHLWRARWLCEDLIKEASRAGSHTRELRTALRRIRAAASLVLDAMDAVSEEPERPPCPRCGSLDVIPIRYGEPSAETEWRSEEEEVALGGCIVMEGQPTHICRTCGNKWQVPGMGPLDRLK
jgi:hypothetical protein